MSITIPPGYRPLLSIYETQKAIGLLNRLFEDKLAGALRLHRVSAPLFVSQASGLNDDLNGVERPVAFDINGVEDAAVVVHSLAKWKRLALKRYQFQAGEGLYTDMNAIRRDETLDSLHSAYVDQWDWEKEREDVFTRDPPVTFLMGIGGELRSGQPHDGRAPDYDDWSLNGDLLVWDSVGQRSFELSSMGIRVDPPALERQLRLAGCEERRELPFHRMLLNGELPLTMGGGIGQSRVSMLMLGKAHIGEVQSSLWDGENVKAAEEAGFTLL